MDINFENSVQKLNDTKMKFKLSIKIYIKNYTLTKNCI